MLSRVAKPIYSISPFTLLDFADRVACIFWMAGCNMRCPYCYNPEIVEGKGKIKWADAFTFLGQRKGFLEGVVLSGGECTLHRDIIPAIREIKEMELAVKIDTNGSRPEVVSTLCRERLIDYVALDFKALSRSYSAVTASYLYTPFVETLDLLLVSDIKFEVRTTVHSQLISLDDLLEMKQYLKDRGYRGDYFIQYFVDDKPTIGSLGPTYRFRDLSQWDDDQVRFVVRN